MYEHRSKAFVRRPRITFENVPEIGPRVRMFIKGTGSFDLDPGEAMNLANDLVDVAEQVTLP